MTDRLEEHVPRGHNVNGHELLTDNLASYTLGVAVGPDAKEASDREATRYLSAATQINIDYAKNVVDRVVNERLRALAPTFGVDVPVVVSWAMKALRTRTIRDYWLTAILVLQFFSIAIIIFWWRWAWIVFLLLFVTAWFVVSWDYHERIHNAVIGKMLRDRFKPEEAPIPAREIDRHRLSAIAERRDGNLVVFSGHSAFVGSGELMYSRRLLLDVSGRKEAKPNADSQPENFTSQDLHTAILAAFSREGGLGESLENIKAYERLFVNGLHVQNDRQLLPNQLRPPPTSVDSTVLHAATVNPSPEGRTYVCVEMPGWQGQLVVTLFIRAVYTGKSLFVEWTFRVLPPIRAEFLGIDDRYEFPRYLQLKDSLASGLRALVPALLASPAHAFSSWWHPRVVRCHQKRDFYAIRRGYVFDYGAFRSIREDASGDQRHHYFLARDETMYVLLAQQTLIRAVGDFLSEHGVDLGQFDDQVKVIFEQSINYNIGDIIGSSGIVIGDNSSATVSQATKGQRNEQRKT